MTIFWVLLKAGPRLAAHGPWPTAGGPAGPPHGPRPAAHRFLVSGILKRMLREASAECGQLWSKMDDGEFFGFFAISIMLILCNRCISLMLYAKNKHLIVNIHIRLF